MTEERERELEVMDCRPLLWTRVRDKEDNARSMTRKQTSRGKRQQDWSLVEAATESYKDFMQSSNLVTDGQMRNKID